MKKSIPEYLSFTGRCGLEQCGGRGHWNDDVTFTLKANRTGTKFWYEASCSPGKQQPQTRLHGRQEAISMLTNYEFIKELRAHLVQPELIA